MRTNTRSFAARAVALFLCFSALCAFVLYGGPAAGQVDVWVDPGHCCGDPGAVGFNGDDPPNEKDLTFAVANWLQGDLFSLGYFTYKTVNYSTTALRPFERARIANGLLGNEDGDQGVPYLFVSIHMNSWEDASKKGTITFYI